MRKADQALLLDDLDLLNSCCLPACLASLCLPALQMMGKKALEAAQTLVDELDLHGHITPEQFLTEREEALGSMFPTAQLLPGAGGCCRISLHLLWPCSARVRQRHAGMDMPGCC